MNASSLSFIAKVLIVSGAIGVGIKYLLPGLLVDFSAGQNAPALATVVALLVAPSALMGGLLWLRRGADL